MFKGLKFNSKPLFGFHVKNKKNKYFTLMSFVLLPNLMLTGFMVHAEEIGSSNLILPLKLNNYGLPTVTLKLNGTEHTALLDLGSADGIHLPVGEIKKIKGLKYTGKTINSVNLAGETQQNKEFLIPSLTLQGMSFDNVIGVELTPWSVSIGEDKLAKQSDEIVLGLGFFKGKNISINYESKTLRIDNGKLKSSNTNKNTIPFVVSAEGISMQLHSKNANYQMILDSGASSSIFVANKVNPKEELNSCDFDLGPELTCRSFNNPLNIAGYSFHSNILLFPVDKRFSKDGILGGDFFHQFVVEIDFAHNYVALTPIKS